MRTKANKLLIKKSESVYWIVEVRDQFARRIAFGFTGEQMTDCDSSLPQKKSYVDWQFYQKAITIMLKEWALRQKGVKTI